MSRKPTKGYYVRGHFVAEGSELDLELKSERISPPGPLPGFGGGWGS